VPSLKQAKQIIKLDKKIYQAWKIFLPSLGKNADKFDKF
jgi:hypothetical protein